MSRLKQEVNAVSLGSHVASPASCEQTIRVVEMLERNDIQHLQKRKHFILVAVKSDF